jgi:hypothetical protein
LLRERENVKTFFACILLVSATVLLCPHARAQYEPFAVEVDPQEVSFTIDGPPGMYRAALPLNVSVSSGFSEWSLHCQASPMVEVNNGWVIPASRIMMEGGYEDVLSDADGLLSIDQPVLIGQGTFTGPEFVPVAVLNFRVQSEWGDRPGTYAGQLTLTYLAVP